MGAFLIIFFYTTDKHIKWLHKYYTEIISTGYSKTPLRLENSVKTKIKTRHFTDTRLFSNENSNSFISIQLDAPNDWASNTIHKT